MSTFRNYNKKYVVYFVFYSCSFDEMAKHDLPSTVDFIVKKTGQEELHYVGCSQGATTGR